MNARRNGEPPSVDDFTDDQLRRIEARWKSDVDLKLDRMEIRLRVIEHLIWAAVGGVAIIGALATIGIGIIIKQGERIDAIALRQASAIAERVAHEESMKADISRLKDQFRVTPSSR